MQRPLSHDEATSPIATLALDGVLAPSRAVERFARTLAAGSLPSGGTIVRLVQRIGEVHPLAWLAAQPRGARTLFRGPDRTHAGVGVARTIDAVGAGGALAAAGALVGEESGASAMVTARFDTGAIVSPEWRSFGTARASLPRIELAVTASGSALALHVVTGDAHDHVLAMDQLAAARPPLASPPRPSRAAAGLLERLRTQPPSTRWLRGVRSLLAEMDEGSIEKAVVARPFDVALGTTADAIALAGALEHGNPGAFVYVVEAGDRAFVGASPELLYQRSGERVTSEALAGTRTRGASDAEDDRLARELLSDEKERREHDLVVDHVVGALGSLCRSTPCRAPVRVRRLATVQHLSCVVEGFARPGADDAAFVEALHPTPAVCGYPLGEARARIREIERFDRGLYGGPIGVVGGGSTTLAVALRCALVRGTRARLFAGAGIVSGSSPEREWRETASKLGAFASILDPRS